MLVATMKSRKEEKDSLVVIFYESAGMSQLPENSLTLELSGRSVCTMLTRVKNQVLQVNSAISHPQQSKSAVVEHV